MDGNYIITSNGNFISEDELYHWGTKGMKWGVRRYQNADGSLTAAGRRRYTNPDGSLNDKGKKYYAKEKKRLSDERKAIKAREKTDAQLARLDAQRKANKELSDSIDSAKKKTSESASDDSSRKRDETQIRVADMSLKELTDRNNRMVQEANFKQNMEKLGYSFYEGPKTEADYKIEELKKQKEILSLQKDIRDLTPKKVSIGKKFAEKVLFETVAPAFTEFAKERGKGLAKELADKVKADADAKAAKDKEKKAAKEAADKAEKAARAAKEAKEAADKKAYDDAMYKKYNEPYNDPYYKDRPAPSSQYRSQPNAREYVNPNEPRGLAIYSPSVSKKSSASAYDTIREKMGSGKTSTTRDFNERVASKQKEYSFDTEAKTGTVEGAGASSSKYANRTSSKASTSKPIIDLNSRGDDGTYYYNTSASIAKTVAKTVSDIAFDPSTSAGMSYVARYLTSSIAGYLPAPKDRDD